MITARTARIWTLTPTLIIIPSLHLSVAPGLWGIALLSLGVCMD